MTTGGRLAAPPPGAGLARLRAAGPGALPAFAAMVVAWVAFGLAGGGYLTAANLTDVALRSATVGMLVLGLSWVLMLGELDLAVAALSALAAAVAAVASIDGGAPGWLAIVIGLAIGVGAGVLQGAIVAFLGMPSALVTLAGLVGWQGLELHVLGQGGYRDVTDPAMLALADRFLPPAGAWPLAGVAAAVALGLGHRARLGGTRGRAGGAPRPVAPRAVLWALGVLVAAAILTRDRGVPVALLVTAALAVALEILLRRTPFGRRVRATGRDRRGAPRGAPAVRLAVFALSGLLAAAGGLMEASRGMAVTGSSGGTGFLLAALAGAILGGASPRGGRGSMLGALVGALAAGSVLDGIDLLGLPSGARLMIPAAMLLAALAVDAAAPRAARPETP